MQDQGKSSVGDSLLSKLEEFGGTLDDEERAAFVQLLSQGQPATDPGKVSKEELRRALDFLAANRLGRLDVARRRDDDGFWAQWAQRQY